MKPVPQRWDGRDHANDIRASVIRLTVLTRLAGGGSGAQFGGVQQAEADAKAVIDVLVAHVLHRAEADGGRHGTADEWNELDHLFGRDAGANGLESREDKFLAHYPTGQSDTRPLDGAVDKVLVRRWQGGDLSRGQFEPAVYLGDHLQQDGDVGDRVSRWHRYGRGTAGNQCPPRYHLLAFVSDALRVSPGLEHVRSIFWGKRCLSPALLPVIATTVRFHDERLSTVSIMRSRDLARNTDSCDAPRPATTMRVNHGLEESYWSSGKGGAPA